jgi:hypothetical protein
MHLVLTRFAYTPENTQGSLRIEGTGIELYTIERPWIEHDQAGGRPFESCIPDGTYDLVPYRRRNGDKVFALVNADLGVYFTEAARIPDANGIKHGRYKCLVHPGNYVDDVVGCIAPGTSRSIHSNRMMVGSSRAAMQQIMNLVPFERGSTIEIKPALGATDH